MISEIVHTCRLVRASFVLAREGVFGSIDPSLLPPTMQLPLRLARLIERGFLENVHTIVEAGTGVGKSLAYLVPALRAGGRVVVSTGTIALQEQLVRKDIPLVTEALGIDARVVLLKGRNHYLCKAKFEKESGARLVAPSLALERLWAEQEQRLLTCRAYKDMGGLEGALAQHAEDIFNSMHESEQIALRRLLCRLVNVARAGEGEDTKRPQTREELGEELWAMAQRMAGHSDDASPRPPARLIVAYRDEKERDVAEIIHEALIRHWPRLKVWLDEERSFRVLADELQRAQRDGKRLTRSAST